MGTERAIGIGYVFQRTPGLTQATIPRGSPARQNLHLLVQRMQLPLRQFQAPLQMLILKNLPLLKNPPECR
jgi:hypothetical protein